MNKKEIKRIGILTSGGDAPGMNSAIRSIVKSSIAQGLTPYFIYEGYKGLVEGNIRPAKKADVKWIEKMGGTILYSARYPEFKKEEVRLKAVKNLKKHNIDALITIGGDGTYQGAAALSKMGINTIALPGTIDNDIPLTQYTIGYQTALVTIVEAVEKIRSTQESHNRVSVIEVMGRNCGDLAINAAIAASVEVLSTPENKLSEKQIIEEIKYAKAQGDRSVLVLVTELIYDVKKLSTLIEKETKFETRSTVLGHIQRGGNPDVSDRILASLMGTFAIQELISGKTSVAVGLIDGALQSKDINEIVNQERKSNKWLYEQYNLIK